MEKWSSILHTFHYISSSAGLFFRTKEARAGFYAAFLALIQMRGYSFSMNDKSEADTNITALAHQFQSFYDGMTMKHIDRLGELYAENIIFTDPIKTVQGLAALTDYYRETFSTASDFDFTFVDEPVLAKESAGQSAVFEWHMTFSQKKLNGGRPIVLPGLSKVRYSGAKIIEHRDYYDLGKMIYEHLPVVGGLVKKLRNSIA